ncbi:MAG: TRAP transporter substrate-binding protein DctP [Treponema sp.]
MRKIIAVVFCFFSVFLFAEEKITLKIATVAPGRSAWDIELKKLAEEWYRITNGAIEVKTYNMTTLGGEKAGIQKLKAARPGQQAPLDGAIFTTIGLHELVPEAYVYTLTLPFLIQNQQELNAVLDVHGKKIESKIKQAGYELVTWSNVGWLSFYTKDSYSTLAELKKIKLSISGLDSPILSDSFKVSGFTVVDTPAQKFSQALKSKNGMRGFFAVHLLTYAIGFYKDINYALDIKLCPVMAAFVISNDSWKKIPEKYHAPMKAAAEKTRKRLNDALDISDADCVKKMESAGITMIRPPRQELTKWEAEFNQNIEDIYRAFPYAFDMQMYKDIQKLIEPMRK